MTGNGCPLRSTRSGKAGQPAQQHAASLITLIVALAISSLGFAAPIKQRLANNLVANADYVAGTTDQPAVLILHGLLATHHFPTVQRIADDLRDNGYTVLAPTLTLGITNRTASLPCNALQLHTMEQTVAELAWWVNWLAEQGHQQIYLIGHSAGSLQILIYSLTDPHPAVKGQVLTSLVSMEPLPGKLPEGESADLARKRLSAGNQDITNYDVSFCHGNFAAPPKTFLSYNHWDKQSILAALKKTTLPFTVIMGERDHRFVGIVWMPMLRENIQSLVILKEANHFFDGPAEFDLLDSIHAALVALPGID